MGLLLRNQSFFVAVATTHQIKEFDYNGNLLTTIGAGSGAFRDGGFNFARFNEPYSLTAAPNGTIYVADRQHHRIH